MRAFISESATEKSRDLLDGISEIENKVKVLKETLDNLERLQGHILYLSPLMVNKGSQNEILGNGNLVLVEIERNWRNLMQSVLNEKNFLRLCYTPIFNLKLLDYLKGVNL